MVVAVTTRVFRTPWIVRLRILLLDGVESIVLGVLLVILGFNHQKRNNSLVLIVLRGGIIVRNDVEKHTESQWSHGSHDCMRSTIPKFSISIFSQIGNGNGNVSHYMYISLAILDKNNIVLNSIYNAWTEKERADCVCRLSRI